ncbi:MAG: 50S ribosomal protein L25 [Candidatus Krumholzibacteria bacterium]|nr:50S ribosomal protein L25 [Candidatus Krumholzibacteria bacterium]
MGLVNLNIFPRTTTGKNANRRSRVAGRVPAVVYGNDRTTENFELDTHDFTAAMTLLAGRSAIFSLLQDGVDEEHIALLREVQRNPVTDEVLHIDLYEIPRGREVTVAVQVSVIGMNADVKSGEASVALSLDSIELSCRPSQLPEVLEIDITELVINDKIFVKDVVAPVGEIISDPEMLVLNIKPASIFIEEEEEPEEGLEGEEGEVEGEGAEGSEGDGEKSED